MTGKVERERCHGRQGICNLLSSRKLTFVEQDHDLVEAVHEVHVVVAVFLNLQDEGQFGAIVGGEGLEELRVDLEVAECLVCDQLFLLVPLAQRHDRRPDLRIEGDFVSFEATEGFEGAPPGSKAQS